MVDDSLPFEVTDTMETQVRDVPMPEAVPSIVSPLLRLPSVAGDPLPQIVEEGSVPANISCCIVVFYMCYGPKFMAPSCETMQLLLYFGDAKVLKATFLCFAQVLTRREQLQSRKESKEEGGGRGRPKGKGRGRGKGKGGGRGKGKGGGKGKTKSKNKKDKEETKPKRNKTKTDKSLDVPTGEEAEREQPKTRPKAKAKAKTQAKAKATPRAKATAKAKAGAKRGRTPEPAPAVGASPEKTGEESRAEHPPKKARKVKEAMEESRMPVLEETADGGSDEVELKAEPKGKARRAPKASPKAAASKQKSNSTGSKQVKNTSKERTNKTSKPANIEVPSPEDNEARLIEGLADTLLSTLVREWKSGRVNLRGDDFEKRVFSRSSFSPYYTRSRPSVGLKTRLPTWRSNKEFANFSFPMADVLNIAFAHACATHTALSQVILNCKGCFQCFFIYSSLTLHACNGGSQCSMICSRS